MAAATTIAAISGVIAVLGAAVGTVATIESANAQAKQAEKEADLKEEQDREIRRRQQANEQVLRRRAMQTLGEQQTRFASSGVDIGTGAPLQVMSQLYDDLELDIQASRQEAAFNSYVMREEAGAKRSLAGATRTAGYLSAGGTLLSGAAGAYKIADPKTGK